MTPNNTVTIPYHACHNDFYIFKWYMDVTLKENKFVAQSKNNYSILGNNPALLPDRWVIEPHFIVLSDS